jgi:hypothetical protein
MMRPQRAGRAAASLGFVVALTGCNFIVGVGDYRVGGADDDGAAETDVGYVDSGYEDVRPPQDACCVADRGIDTGIADASYADVRVEDAGSADANYGDVNLEDAGSADANYGDVNLKDAGSADANYVDAHTGDAGLADANYVDVSAPDAARGDAAYVDSQADQTAADSGGYADGGADARPADGAAPPDANVKCGASLPGANDTAFQQLVTACTLAISCDPEYFDTNISGCITNNLFASSKSDACLSSVTSCAAFDQCWGIGYASVADVNAADNDGGGACEGDGNLAVNGETAVIYEPGSFYNCDLLGGICAPMSTGSGSFAACMVPPGGCSNPDSNTHCYQGYAYQCIDGIAYGKECSAVGETCVENEAVAGCSAIGSTCATAPGTATCNGTTLQVCAATDQAFSYDCAVAGEVCLPDAGACVSPGCATPAAAPCVESCDGFNTISVCVGGAPLAIDCTKVGVPGQFTTCYQDSTVVANGLLYAWCE